MGKRKEGRKTNNNDRIQRNGCRLCTKDINSSSNNKINISFGVPTAEQRETERERDLLNIV